MQPRRQATQRRRLKSRGNVMIESVFTMLPTFALIFALTDFGLMLFRWSTLQNAVREGARYAITFQQADDGSGGSLGQDDSIKQVVERYAMGLVGADDSPQHIFVTYYTQDDPNTPVGTGGNVPGNIVEVSVQNVTLDWLAPLSGSYGAGVPLFRSTDPITLEVYASDILGAYPVGVSTVPQ